VKRDRLPIKRRIILSEMAWMPIGVDGLGGIFIPLGGITSL